MKRKKRIVSFVLTLLMIATVMPLSTVPSDAADSTSGKYGNGFDVRFSPAEVKSLLSNAKYGADLQRDMMKRPTTSIGAKGTSAPTENTPDLLLEPPAYAATETIISIPIVLKNTSLGTLQFCLTYDETVLQYEYCANMMFNMYDINATKDGLIRAACADQRAVLPGRIAVLYFTVKSTAVNDAQLILTVEEAYDENDDSVLMGPYAWEIRIFQTLPGDVNGDRHVTALDARWVLQATTGERTLNDEQKRIADVNGDGKVDAIDARWILQVASGSRKL